MKCWNCGYEVEEGTKVCRKCEADQSEGSSDPEVGREAAGIAAGLFSPSEIEELKRMALESATAEGFADAIMVGPCAKCGSSKVGDCGDDPDHLDPFLGRCFECGAVWCTECGHVLGKDEKTCPDMEAHMEGMPPEPDL